MAGWTLPLQMGVRHAAVSARFEADAVKLDAIPLPQGAIENAAAPAFFVPAGRNDDFRFANRLHDAEVPFRVYSGGGNFWSDRNDPVVPLGSIVVANTTDTREKIKTAHEGLSVELQALRVSPAENAIGLKPMREPRLGLYQPWTASMDEGWTRLVLDNFEFDYVSLHNAEIRAGDLADRYDCIVLPSIPTRQIVQGRAADTSAPEFTGGIGEEGIVALQDFVLAGGTLVAIDESCNLPIDRFNVPVKNIVRDLKTEEFYCPGSVLRLRIDPNDELGWGMPEWYSGYFAGSQAFEIVPEQNGAAAEKERQPANRFPSTAVSRYSDTVLLESGWIRGGNLITDKPAIVRTTYGSGSIVLIGFGVQRRGQPHGTFRILFNAIQSSTL